MNDKQAQQGARAIVDHAVQSVREHPEILKYLPFQTPEICWAAIDSNPAMLDYVSNQTPEMCREMVKRDWSNLQYVHDQTEKLCLDVVREHGAALRHVRKQTFRICEAAVKNDESALEFVTKQSYYETLYEMLEDNRLAGPDGTVLDRLGAKLRSMFAKGEKKEEGIIDKAKEQAPDADDLSSPSYSEDEPKTDARPSFAPRM